MDVMGEPICLTPQEIVERIMTAHWDIAACQCWVCRSGRNFGFHPVDDYLLDRNDNRERFQGNIGWSPG
jgi:hypothetical protein